MKDTRVIMSAGADAVLHCASDDTYILAKGYDAEGETWTQGVYGLTLGEAVIAAAPEPGRSVMFEPREEAFYGDMVTLSCVTPSRHAFISPLNAAQAIDIIASTPLENRRIALATDGSIRAPLMMRAADMERATEFLDRIAPLVEDGLGIMLSDYYDQMGASPLRAFRFSGGSVSCETVELDSVLERYLDGPRDRAIYTVSRADILDIARWRGIELTRDELERAVAELTRSHMGDDLDGTMCEYIDDAIDRIEERRGMQEGIELIAVGVGNCFRVVPKADTDGIDLMPSALTIEYGGETYELMRGATYKDSSAIDDILDRKGELYIDDYNPSPAKPANRPKR